MANPAGRVTGGARTRRADLAEPELEPLDLSDLDPEVERRERLRLLFVWCKIKAAEGHGVRPEALRAGNGYSGQGDERKFYDD